VTKYQHREKLNGVDQGAMAGAAALARRQAAEIATLRRLLWLSHAGHMIYGDDGETQCNQCMIDFKRDPVDVIERKITEAGLKARADVAFARGFNALFRNGYEERGPGRTHPYPRPDTDFQRGFNAGWEARQKSAAPSSL